MIHVLLTKNGPEQLHHVVSAGRTGHWLISDENLQSSDTLGIWCDDLDVCFKAHIDNVMDVPWKGKKHRVLCFDPQTAEWLSGNDKPQRPEFYMHGVAIS